MLFMIIEHYATATRPVYDGSAAGRMAPDGLRTSRAGSTSRCSLLPGDGGADRGSSTRGSPLERPRRLRGHPGDDVGGCRGARRPGADAPASQPSSASSAALGRHLASGALGRGLALLALFARDHRGLLDLDARRLDLGDDLVAVGQRASRRRGSSGRGRGAWRRSRRATRRSTRSTAGRWSGSARTLTVSVGCRSVPPLNVDGRRVAGGDERDVDRQLLGHRDQEQVDMERAAVDRVDLDARGRGPAAPSRRRPTGRRGRCEPMCRRSCSNSCAVDRHVRRIRRRGRRRRPAAGRRGAGG